MPATIVGATFGRPFMGNNYLQNYGLVVNNKICKINAIYKKSVIIDEYVILYNGIDGSPQVYGRPKVAPTNHRLNH